MAKEENDILNAICDYMKLKRWFVFRVNTAGIYDKKNDKYRKPPRHSVNGVSDLIAIKGGRTIFIEVKTKTGRQEESQMEFEYNIKKHAGEYLLARSTDDLIRYGI